VAAGAVFAWPAFDDAGFDDVVRAALERAAPAVTTGRAEEAGWAAVAAGALLVRGAAGVLLAGRFGVATRLALRFAAGLTERRVGCVAPLVVADTDGAEALGAAVAGACAVALAVGAVAGAAAEAGALGAGLVGGATAGPVAACDAGGVVDGVGGVAGVPKPGGVQAQARLAPAAATLSIDRMAK
jgi:hypothetical protein